MKKELLKFVVLALLAIGGAPAGAAIYQWSQTPATNGNVDGTINWAVGMAPSAVDPSARSMMARVAEYRDDISGSLATGGTSTAYTVTTNQNNSGGTNGICGAGVVPINGQMIAVTMTVANGTSPTIAVDGCTAAPIQSATGVAVPSGLLQAGTPYSIKYSTANTAWMLRDLYSLGNNPFAVPLGALLPYTGSTAPNANFILPAGQCISTTTFAAYWALLGSPGVGGCSAGNFAVVDLRGNVPAGLDNLNGSAASRLTSSATGCGTAMTSLGAQCANGTQGSAITLAQVPTGITSANAGSIALSVSSTQQVTHEAGGGVAVAGSAVTQIAPDFTLTSTGTIGIGNAAVTSNNTSGTVRPGVQPTIAVSYILRVL
jgi:hypothetical protein